LSTDARCTPPVTGFAANVAAIQKRYTAAPPALTPEEQAAATLLMEVGRHSQADAERIARLLAPVFLPF
jgi:hypothetical protein